MSSISFPATPSDGQLANGYRYDSATQTWLKPDIGSLLDILDVGNYPEAEHGSRLVFDGYRWIPDKISVAPGQMFSFAGTVAPSGYLICDGSVLSQTQYANLYSVVGTSYNTGSEGSGNFRLPNLNGRVAAGWDDGAPTADFRPIGKTAGTKSVTLTTDQIPSHTHDQLPHTHIQNAHNHTQDAHSHNYNVQFYPSGWEAGGYGTGYYGSFRDRVMTTSSYSGLGTDGRTPTIQGKVAVNQNTQATNQNTGGGQAHANLQPYIVINYIIKT